MSQFTVHSAPEETQRLHGHVTSPYGIPVRFLTGCTDTRVFQACNSYNAPLHCRNCSKCSPLWWSLRLCPCFSGEWGCAYRNSWFPWELRIRNTLLLRHTLVYTMRIVGISWISYFAYSERLTYTLRIVLNFYIIDFAHSVKWVVGTTSLNVFKDLYSGRIAQSFIIHPKSYI